MYSCAVLSDVLCVCDTAGTSQSCAGAMLPLCSGEHYCQPTRSCHKVSLSLPLQLLVTSLFLCRLPDVVDGGLTKEELMTALLSVPVNDSLLQQPLSQLPFSTVVVSHSPIFLYDVIITSSIPLS